MASSVIILYLFSWFVLASKANIILQNKEHCGSYKAPKEIRILDLDEMEVHSHSGRQYYAPNADCIVTIIGKQYYQWEINLLNLDIDGHDCDLYTPCCNDYLKIFNSYRVDNARLFPSIPWRGFCGKELPRRQTFTSTQNYITIQFNSDIKRESKTGFSMFIRQYKRRNSGTEFHETGYIGGWNDGTLSELQIDWSASETIPGDYTPNELPDFEYDPNGVSCFVCQTCDREFFDSDDIGITVRDGCFVCTKEWFLGSGQANRDCLSRNQYRNKLLTYRDTTANDDRVTDFRECRTLSRGVTETSYIKLCICDTNKCNSGTQLGAHWLKAFVFISIVSLIRSLV